MPGGSIPQLFMKENRFDFADRTAILDPVGEVMFGRYASDTVSANGHLIANVKSDVLVVFSIASELRTPSDDRSYHELVNLIPL